MNTTSRTTSADYTFFEGDSYAFAEPEGNTIAFTAGGDVIDLFLMKSIDNGTTWTKTVIWQSLYNLGELPHIFIMPVVVLKLLYWTIPEQLMLPVNLVRTAHMVLPTIIIIVLPMGLFTGMNIWHNSGRIVTGIHSMQHTK